MSTKVVILGAGFGGLAAARALRGRKDVEVTVVERTNHHLFQPLLYQVAMAGLNPSEIASPIRSILSKQKNVTCLMGMVDKIVNEPVGGAHRDYKQAAAFLKRALSDAFRQIGDLKVKELLDRRYDRLQGYGRFTDTRASNGATK